MKRNITDQLIVLAMLAFASACSAAGVLGRYDESSYVKPLNFVGNICSVDIASMDDFDVLQNADLKNCVNDGNADAIVLQLKGDILASSNAPTEKCIANTFSLNVKDKDVVLRGDNHSLKNVCFKDNGSGSVLPSFFEKVNNLYVDSLTLENVYLASNATSFGLFAGEASSVMFNKVTLKNIDAQFNNPCENYGILVGKVNGPVFLHNMESEKIDIDGVAYKNIGGLIGYVSDSLFIDNSNLDVSISLKGNASSLTSSNSFALGGFVGFHEKVAPGNSSSLALSYFRNNTAKVHFLVDGDEQNPDKDFNFENVAVGGFVGFDDVKYVDLSSSVVSGSIDVSGHHQNDSENTRAYRIGGFFGSLLATEGNSEFSIISSKSEIDFNVDSLPYGICPPGVDSCSANYVSVGGFIGSTSFMNAASIKVILDSDEYSGEQKVNQLEDSNVYVAGFLGFADGFSTKYTEMELSNLSLTNAKKAISVYAGASSVGGIVASAMNSNVHLTGNNLFEKQIDVSYYGKNSTKEANIGGLFGAVFGSFMVEIDGVMSSADINVGISTVNTALRNADVGGFFGFVQCDRTPTKKSVLIENSMKSGKIFLENADESLNIGGFIGHLEFCSDVEVAFSGIENDSIIHVTYVDDFVDSTHVGGILGLVSFENLSDNVFNLHSAFASGDIVAETGKNFNSTNAYVSGLVGFAENGKNDYRAFYYKGVLDVDPSIEKSHINGFGYYSGSDIVFYCGYYAGMMDSLYEMYSGRYASLDFYGVLPKSKEIHGPSSANLFDSINSRNQYFAYKNGSDEDYNLWYFDDTKNDKFPMLRYVPGAPATIPSYQFFFDDGIEGYHEYYFTDYRGEIIYDGSGLITDSTLLIRPVPKKINIDSITGDEYTWVATDSKGKSVIWDGLENTSINENLTFKKAYVSKFAVTFKKPDGTKLDSTSYWNGNSFDVSTSDTLPSVAFMSNNLYYLSNRWHEANDALTEFTTLEEVKAYAASKNLGTVNLVYSTDVAKCEPYTSSWYITNLNSLRISATIFGRDFDINMYPNLAKLPLMEKFKIVDVNGTTEPHMFDVSYDGFSKQIRTGDVVTLGYTSSDISVFYCTSCVVPVEPDDEDSTKVNPKDSSKIDSVPGKNNGSGHVKVVLTDEECIEESRIENADVLLSGTAARFVVDMYVPSGCSKVRAKVYVKDADGSTVLADSMPSKSGKKKFTLYPLDPGKYSFTVKVSSKNKKTINREISTTVRLRGGEWHMVSAGAWPKNALKGVGASMFYWDETKGFGEYWQYQALPSLNEVREMDGYWLYTEKNVEFDLAMPLKEAESDSFAWDVKKVFHGWNMVANPYSWNIYSGSIEEFMSAEDGSSPIWRWDSKNASYEVADTLFANESFWVKVDKSRKINVSSAPVFPAMKKDSTKALKKASASRDSWSMRLVASTSDGSSDSWNVIGVGSKDISIEKPPVGYGSAMSVALVDNSDGNTRLAKSIYASSTNAEDGYTWKMNMFADKASSMKLSLDGLESVKSLGYRVVLIDDDEVVEWGDSESIDVKVPEKSKNVLLKVVKADAVVASAIAGIGNLRVNTFAGAVNVLFDLSSEMAGKEVSVRVVSIDGKVSAMERSVSHAGSNEFSFGKVKRSGVYVLQVRVGNESRTLKFAL